MANFIDIPVVPFAIAAVSLAIGIMLTWFFMRSRIEAASERAKVEGVAERATISERLRSLEAERQQLNQDHEALKGQASDWRTALDIARDERSQLNERASRVPSLESHVGDLLGQEKVQQQEILRLATSEAEKSQSLQSMSLRIAAVESKLASTEHDLNAAETFLQQSNERRATLEADGIRIPGLETKLATVEQALNLSRQECTQLSERALRVPSLEIQVSSFLEAQKTNQQDILRLATSEAEKSQSLQSTSTSLTALEKKLSQTESELSAVQVLLQQSNERRATLEAEGMRIPGLETKLVSVEHSLNVAREESTQLSERALRVPSLETQIIDLLQTQNANQLEIRRLATSEAEKAQFLQSVSARLTEVEQDLVDAEQNLSSISTLLQQSQERKATLEAEATRILSLEAELSASKKFLLESNRQGADLREASGRMNAELKAERDSHATVRGEWVLEKSNRELAEVQVNKFTTEIAELNSSLNAERNQAAEKLTLLMDAKDALSNQFKSLANDILEEKSKRFTDQNQVNIGQLLNPLKERMSEFKAKVEEIHIKDAEQQAALRSELGQLKDLNRQMSEEAHGLATALKGQAKKQGNWGELVLGNVLDRSGLREGQDFKREVSFNTDEGRKRPDVVIYLPQSKHLVIDAKVSLNAYTRYVNADDDASRQQALQEHVSAVASRIQELSNRVYFDLPGLNSPEMVFMFIPIESAFVEALRADETLFQKAIEKNVLVATPTTLLTSLNIVRQLWRFEEQNAHTAELADRASKVYKKLVTFLSSMDAVGKQLDKAKESFGTAMGQLYTGKGNLISQAKEFEKLGVSVQSPLPQNLAAKAALELEYLPTAVDVTVLETAE